MNICSPIINLPAPLLKLAKSTCLVVMILILIVLGNLLLKCDIKDKETSLLFDVYVKHFFFYYGISVLGNQNREMFYAYGNDSYITNRFHLRGRLYCNRSQIYSGPKLSRLKQNNRIKSKLYWH